MNMRNTSSLAALSAFAVALFVAAPAQAQTYDHLQCFKIKDAKTFKKASADLTVAAGHLAGLENCQIKTKAKEYCVPAHKMNVLVTDGTHTPVEGQEHGYDRLCYKVKCPKVTILSDTVGDQFGARLLDKFKASTICTPAIIGTPPAEDPPVWPADPQDYTAGPSSYVDTLTLPSLDGMGNPTCCKDFGSKSANPGFDNGLAKLADGLSSLGLDVQQTLDDALSSGELVILLDHQNLDLFTQPDEFTLVQLLGAFEGATDYTAASAGLGTFLATQSSFVAGTGEPLNWFHPADMGTTSMSAEPFSLSLSLPFGFLTLSVKAAEASATADHGAITAGGVPYTNGELAGYVLMDELFEQLNALLNAPQCDCLGHTSDIYEKLIDGSWSSQGNCISNASSLCTDPAEGVCVSLASDALFGNPPGVCAVLPGVLQEQADIDLNSDPTVYEAMSVGLQFTAQNAQIVGVEP